MGDQKHVDFYSYTQRGRDGTWTFSSGRKITQNTRVDAHLTHDQFMNLPLKDRNALVDRFHRIDPNFNGGFGSAPKTRAPPPPPISIPPPIPRSSYFPRAPKALAAPPKSHIPTSKSHSSTPKPHTSMSKPHISTPKSHAGTPKPHGALSKPHIPTPKPHTSTPKSHASTPKPHISTPKSHASTPKAHIHTPKSHISAAKPPVPTPNPLTSAPKSHVPTPKKHACTPRTARPPVPRLYVPPRKRGHAAPNSAPPVPVKSSNKSPIVNIVKLPPGAPPPAAEICIVCKKEVPLKRSPTKGIMACQQCWSSYQLEHGTLTWDDGIEVKNKYV